MSSTTVEADIWSRLVDPSDPSLSPEAARAILDLRLPALDIERVNALSAKARAGTLTDAEQAELDSYERVGHFLGLLQSKARRSLRHLADDNRDSLLRS